VKQQAVKLTHLTASLMSEIQTIIHVNDPPCKHRRKVYNLLQ